MMVPLHPCAIARPAVICRSIPQMSSILDVDPSGLNFKFLKESSVRGRRVSHELIKKHRGLEIFTNMRIYLLLHISYIFIAIFMCKYVSNIL